MRNKSIHNEEKNDDNKGTFKSSDEIMKILLVGYNGANNTGSEARLLSIIDDIRTVFGCDVEITVPTLNEKNLRRYLKEEQGLHIAPVPSIFFYTLRKLVKQHDLILLVEGSCYMDTWTSALLWAFLWSTRCAYEAGIPCIAYAVDSGELSNINKYLVKREASKTDLIITRTNSAKNRLESVGVTAPMEVTADCAFTFNINDDDQDICDHVNIVNDNGLVGLSVVDFHLWPVVIRPWGKKEYLYKWPYYFSRSKKRLSESEELASQWAKIADDVIKEYNKEVLLICMEEVDESLAYSIQDKMIYQSKAQVISSREFNASQMTIILRCLDLLVTSRYHAAVLSLEALIPQIAVGHDTRLKDFYKELKLNDYLLDSNSPDLWNTLKYKIKYLLDNPGLLKESLNDGYEMHLKQSHQNQLILRRFIIKKGWNVIK